MLIIFPLNILSQDVVILYPKPETKLFPNEQIEITWTNPTNHFIDLFYRLDNNNWELIASNIAGTSYEWIVPNSTAEKISFMVQYYDIRTPDLYWHEPDAFDVESRSGLFTPSGKFLLVASTDNYLRLWDVEKKELAYEINLNNSRFENLSLRYAVPFEDTKAFLALENYLFLIDFTLPNPFVHYIDHGTEIYAMDYTSVNGGMVAVTSKENKIFIYDTGLFLKKSYLSNGANSEIYSVRFSRDGSIVCMSDYDGFIDCYNLQSDELVLAKSGHGSPGVNTVAWSVDITRDNQLAVSCGTDRTVRIWNQESESPLQIFNNHLSHVRSVRTSPTDDIMISGSLDSYIRLYNTSGLYEFERIAINNGSPVLSVDFTSDGDYIVGSGRGNEFKIWRIYKHRSYEDVVESTIYREVNIYIPDLAVNLNENFIIPVLSDYDKSNVTFTNNVFDIELTLEIPILIIDSEILKNVSPGSNFETVNLKAQFDITKDTVIAFNATSLLGPTNYGEIRIVEIKTGTGLEILGKDGSVTITQECPGEFVRGLVVEGSLPGIVISPNPAKDNLSVKIDVVENGFYDLNISNINGSNQINNRIYLNSGSSYLNLDVSNLSNGAYHLQLIGNRVMNSQTVIINR